MRKEWMGLGGEGKRQTKLLACLLKIRIQKIVNWISWSIVWGHKILSWCCEVKILRSSHLAPWRWVHITGQFIKEVTGRTDQLSSSQAQVKTLAQWAHSFTQLWHLLQLLISIGWICHSVRTYWRLFSDPRVYTPSMIQKTQRRKHSELGNIMWVTGIWTDWGLQGLTPPQLFPPWGKTGGGWRGGRRWNIENF